MIGPAYFRAAVWSTLGCFLLSVPAVGAAERPTLVVTEGGRVSLRSKKATPSEFVSRADLLFVNPSSWWTVFPFGEIRKNLDGDGWSRIEAGAEFGVKPFHWFDDEKSSAYLKPLRWIYLGQGFHKAWLSPGNDTAEWETRVVFTAPLPWEIAAKPVEFYGVDEYTYDLELGRGTRNEFGFGLKLPLPFEHFPLKTVIGFRHVDIVHEDDTDQFEGSLQAVF
ncbi:MAG: hypothetical protein NC910_00700 [Candidatus Omnitrophica bacterium]|nr:hypothetical protein [Candidatus Omnitrophota bacterium]